MKATWQATATVILLLASGWSGRGAESPGTARLEVTLRDYNGSGAKHYTVVWVTTAEGAFVKTLRKQGPSNWSSKEWRDHCLAWNTARGSSTVLDGYTSATATTYTGTNSPVVCTWNGRDAAGSLLPDGPYKFWVQYAENNGQGPYTTGGLLWTKGPAGVTNTYPDQGANFAAMRVTWLPDLPVSTAPLITSTAPAAQAVVGVPYAHVCTATGTPPVAFSAAGLPPGLNLLADGQLSGTPLVAGRFEGTISASNGTPPDALQPFSIEVAVVPATLTARASASKELVLSGTGPADANFRLLGSSSLDAPISTWTVLTQGTFDRQGQFAMTNAPGAEVLNLFLLLRVP